MKLLTFSVVAFALLGTIGCNKNISNWVGSGDPTPGVPGTSLPSVAPPQLNYVTGNKVTPGAMNASATNGAIVGTVTPTNRILSGGGMSMQVTISQSRQAP